VNGKTTPPFVPAVPLWMCPPVIDDKSCVTVIVNTFVVLLNLSCCGTHSSRVVCWNLV
jgi:hypothetical protein